MKSENKLKILFITPSVPFPPHTGGQIRSLYLLRYFATKGSVDLVTLGEREQLDPYEQELKKYCRNIYLADVQNSSPKGSGLRPWLLDDFVHPEIRAQIERSSPEQYDVIVCRFSIMAYFFLMDPRLKLLLNKVVVDVDDISTVVQERKIKSMSFGYKKLRYMFDLFLLEQFYRKLKQVRACFVVSDKDRDYVNRNQISRKTFLVPNVYEVNGRALGSLEESKNPEILFCGMMSYPPNQEAVYYFVEEILPKIREKMPNVRFTIVGKNMPDQMKQLSSKPGITVAGYVPSMEPYYQKAALVVVPLQNGGGTRIKILEAFSYERPVVSTTVGAEGLDVKHGESIVLADHADEFANECVDLLNQPERRKRIASNAYRLMKEKYDISVFNQTMDEVFEYLQKGK